MAETLFDALGITEKEANHYKVELLREVIINSFNEEFKITPAFILQFIARIIIRDGEKAAICISLNDGRLIPMLVKLHVLIRLANMSSTIDKEELLEHVDELYKKKLSSNDLLDGILQSLNISKN